MNMNRTKIIKLIIAVIILNINGFVYSEDAIFPTAILDFKAKGVKQEETDSIPLLLMTKLTSNPSIILVERAELDKIISEQELNKSGLVSESDMIKVGRFVGAKIIITGTHFKIDKNTYIVTKIISTETTKVLGVSVNGEKELGALITELGQKINEEISKKGSTIVSSPISREDMIKEFVKKYESKKKPTVSINIKEDIHISSVKIDPAAETEMRYLYEKIGGKIIDKKQDNQEPDFIITGEGFSEFSTKIGKLICVKSRLEVKVVDKGGNIIASERVVVWDVDSAEGIAAKNSLEKAATTISSAIFTKIIEKFN